ncbi:hypothetical protein GGI43DRAFT_46 [Trichoderma evansii]
MKATTNPFPFSFFFETGEIKKKLAMACLNCRRLKVRCIFTSIEPNRCDRCVRFNRSCYFKPRRSRYGENVEVPFRGNSLVDPSSKESVAQPASQNSKTSQNSTTPLNTANIAIKLSPEVLPCQSSAEQYPRYSPKFSPISHPERQPEDRIEIGLSFTRLGNNSQLRADPIYLNLIDLASAQQLISKYFRHFEYNVGFLDPNLYTFSYIRSSSSFLFTTLLSISARIFRRDLYPPLKDHGELLLGRVLASCHDAVENIWAIICMHYWKEAGDERGYTLIDFAMRLAALKKEDLYRPQEHQLPESESEKLQYRQLRDQERLSMNLSSLDRQLCFFSDRLPAGFSGSSRRLSRVELQRNSLYTYGYGDTRATSLLELRDIAGPIYDFISNRKGTSHTENDQQELKSFEISIEAFNSKITQWCRYWSPIFGSFQNSTTSLEPQVAIYGNHMRAYFNSVYWSQLHASSIGYASVSAKDNAMLACCTSSLCVLQAITEIGKADSLYYFWDSAHLMAANSAILLLKVLRANKELCNTFSNQAYCILQNLAPLYTAAATTLRSRNVESNARKPPSGHVVEAEAKFMEIILSRFVTEIFVSSPYNLTTLEAVSTLADYQPGLPQSLSQPTANERTEDANVSSLVDEDVLKGIDEMLSTGTWPLTFPTDNATMTQEESMEWIFNLLMDEQNEYLPNEV